MQNAPRRAVCLPASACEVSVQRCNASSGLGAGRILHERALHILFDWTIGQHIRKGVSEGYSNFACQLQPLTKVSYAPPR